MDDIRNAQLMQNNENTLYATDFEDIYYSNDDALAESNYVFLEGNNLPKRWHKRQRFVIAEAGFGTGLNFLSTWHRWTHDNQRSDTLHYIAIERYPIPLDTLRELHNKWPELSIFSEQLLANYPPVITGFHSIALANGQVTLTLCFMDILLALNELVASVDCWYLDGFAPARNPAMWSTEVFTAMAALSHEHTTLSTFSAAGQVRRNLQAAGFITHKRKGFGRKREMLTAQPKMPASQPSRFTPWFSPSTLWSTATVSPAEQAIVIIGAGITGCQLAHALAIRGWQVTLIERHPEPAREASGNAAGVLTPKMTAEPSWGERFYRQAFLATSRQLNRLTAEGHTIRWQACGALQLNHNPREQQRWQKLRERQLDTRFIQLVDQQQASTLAGISLPTGASYFPQGGWVDPRSFCQVLLNHDNIRLINNTTALTLEHDGSHWAINTSTGTLIRTPYAVIANGKDATQFAQSAFLPLMSVRGQTSTIAATPETVKLATTIGHEGYLTPAINGQHLFGATFDRNQTELALSDAANQHNWQQLQQHLPTLTEALVAPASSHVAIRMTSPDRYPIVGALPDPTLFCKLYANLHQGKRQAHYPDTPYRPGLFIAAAFGSRGLTTSHWCAELLASLITQEPFPAEKSLYYQLHPARFLVKRLKQGGKTSH